MFEQGEIFTPLEISQLKVGIQSQRYNILHFSSATLTHKHMHKHIITSATERVTAKVQESHRQMHSHLCRQSTHLGETNIDTFTP